MRTSFKYTVAAFVLAVGFSSPLAAQDAPPSREEQLFAELQEADPSQVARLEEEIRLIWSRSGSPAMDLLLRRGEDALDEGEFDVAVEHLTALIDHAPDFAEAYHARATAYYQQGEIGPALDDLRQTLVLNPRHFGAMFGFGAILQELGRPEDALEVFRQVEQISPNSPDLQLVIDALETQLEGRAL